MTRLDLNLISRGLATSRERAKEYIISGLVTVNGAVIKKPSVQVGDGDEIRLIGEQLRYVGRGGLKLEGALKAFDIDISGLKCLDLGASTGGFTDCMLQHGASLVYSVDVGHDQLAEKLKNDPRVINIEGVNVKDLTAGMISETVGFAASDLSFISVKFAADALIRLLPDGVRSVLLIKPQFEAGRENISKGGIVKDPKAHISVLDGLCRYFENIGLTVKGISPSPIKGGDGNVEYLAYTVKQNSLTPFTADFKQLVYSALGRL